MESPLIGSFHKSPSFLSFPVAADLTSLKTTSVKVSRCRARNILRKYYVKKSQWQLVACHVGGSNGISVFYQTCNAKYIVNAASGQPFEPEPGAYHPMNPWKSVQDALNAFYRFSRPHTVIGTVRFKFIIVNFRFSFYFLFPKF
ncbi:hypoxanthine-guanine phosphoribosyltransferase [Sarracenia purpurea var. burkii]